MPDIKDQVRQLNADIQAGKAQAAELWTAFSAVKESAVKEGVDFVNDQAAFDRLDAASKAYDSKRDEVAAKEAKRNRLLEVLAEDSGEKALDRADGDVRQVQASWGEAFVKSEAFRAAQAKGAQSDNNPIGVTDAVKVMDRAGLKTLISIAANGDLSPLNDRLGIIVPKVTGPLDFLQVIQTGTTDSDTVEWFEETTLTNAASPTAETSNSPESAIAWTLRQKNVQEITTWVPATRRSLQDAAFVESSINNRLVYFLRARLLQQVLTGAGTGTDLEGIYTNSSIGEVDRSSASVTMLDGLHKCITSIRVNAEQEPDFVGIHPNDWETVMLSRAGAAAATDGGGSYLFGNPITGGPRTIWGVNAIIDSNFTSGSPLVGVGSQAALWIRSGVEVSASDSHDTFFIARKIAYLATMRAAFGLYRPQAFAKCVA
jgi:HK97 family phage major capsid protein